MQDIRSVLSQFNSKKKSTTDTRKADLMPIDLATTSEIPDVFFDVILQQFKLNRHEIALLMYLYRQIWCKANLYKTHGIGPLNSYHEMSSNLKITTDELGTYLRNLENYGLLETVRSGQYFIRKYFTEELDLRYAQDYEDFL